jgi:hypothetical protein
MDRSSPHIASTARGKTCLGPMDEFRDMVKALHRAGIEVILNVVFNHTAEGDERGPTFCFRGLANEDYYLLAPSFKRLAACGLLARLGEIAAILQSDADICVDSPERSPNPNGPSGLSPPMVKLSG